MEVLASMKPGLMPKNVNKCGADLDETISSSKEHIHKNVTDCNYRDRPHYQLSAGYHNISEQKPVTGGENTQVAGL
jgi:hypothetical protein